MVVVWLTVVVMRGGGWDQADPIASVFGAVAGVAALLVTLLRRDSDGEAVAVRLIRKVIATEEVQYKQLLGGDIGGLIDLQFSAQVTGNVEDAPHTGRLKEITAFYRGLKPGRVVITGTPHITAGGRDAGAGKTLTAVVLLLGLARNRASGEAVPVRLSAASWPGGSVEAWLADQLSIVWRLRRAETQLLLEERLVLPIIDGVDELDSAESPGRGSRAAALLEKINAYQDTMERAPVVLTCRWHQYQSLTAADASARTAVILQLNHVDGVQARRYLEGRVADQDLSRARWAPVLDCLSPSSGASISPDAAAAGPDLREAMSTPWRLNLAATVYQEPSPVGSSEIYLRDPAELLSHARNGTIYPYLLDHYVTATISTSPDDHAYSPQQVHRWLHELASYLNSALPGVSSAVGAIGTDLVLHHLWPIAGPRRARYAHALACGLIVMIAGGALSALSLLSPTAPPVLFLMSAAVVVCGLGLRRWAQMWPRPRRPVGLRALRAADSMWRAVKGCMSVGLLALISAGVEISGQQLPVASSPPPRPDWFWPPVLVLGGGIAAVAVLAAAAAMARWLSDVAGATPDQVGAPLATLKGDLVAGLLSSLAFSLTAGIAAGVAMGPWFGIGLSLAALAAVVVVADAWMRYVALLLCTRGRLPWRLGTFMDFSYRAGLLRISGAAYQFRHRELQDWLAAHPTP
ncbi:hypothetical protein ACIA98_41990 [Streptomyces sp. NPDC051366]|uniref:hypothetical protein n=1 Tax=Streptomyces sp. NPDC051366 TaxID=3365652 RepID=UPI00379ED565